MDFSRIDFNTYNKPPFYPQYLSTEDTKKLVSYDDPQLAELDRVIDKMSDQYDLDKARGIFLDRLGKLKDEPRNGNDDELYRLMIRLRILLDTTNGGINDIIKVIKFLYSSEVVHIQPNYPAGLTILHDGEGPPVDFNSIISQVVVAGVSFDTKEIFLFRDALLHNDKLEIIRITKNLRDSFNAGGLKFNGTIKHDGKHKVGKRINDRLALLLRVNDFVDVFNTPLLHNGMIKADGSHVFGGTGRVSDSAVRIKARMNFRDTVTMDDPFTLNIKHSISLTDYFSTRLKFDGTFKHDGKTKAAGARDRLHMMVRGFDLTDKHETVLRHNGTVKADGSRQFNGVTGMGDIFRISSGYKYSDGVNATESQTIKIIAPLEDEVEMQEKCELKVSMNVSDMEEMAEGFSIGMRRHHKHDGRYKANGNYKFNSGVLVPV